MTLTAVTYKEGEDMKRKEWALAAEKCLKGNQIGLPGGNELTLCLDPRRG